MRTKKEFDKRQFVSVVNVYSKMVINKTITPLETRKALVKIYKWSDELLKNWR